jgi:hypothetical protein
MYNYHYIKFLRIITGIIGWTTIDDCLEFVISNNDGVEELKQKIEGGEESNEDIDYLALVARLCAYGMSAYTCMPPFTFRVLLIIYLEFPDIYRIDVLGFGTLVFVRGLSYLPAKQDLRYQGGGVISQAIEVNEKH